MRVVARRKLQLLPVALHCAPAGHILLLGGKGSLVVHAYDPMLEPMWSVKVHSPSGMWLRDDAFWVLEPTAMSAHDQFTGKPITRIRVPVPNGMRVGAVIPVEGGFVMAMEHLYGEPVAGPVMMRISESGEVQWQSEPPSGDLSFPIVRYSSGRATAGRLGFSSWQCGPVSTAVVSGDAVLVVYRNCGAQGFAYVMSLHNGAFRYHTVRGFMHDVAALGGGEFLVACHRTDDSAAGPAASETLHYDRGGTIANRWPSHGCYIVADDEIRMVECTGDKRPMHVTCLEGAGKVHRGDWLEGRHMSPPRVCSDGLVRFIRHGLIYAVRGLSVVDQVTVSDVHDDLYGYQLENSNGSLYGSWLRYGPTVCEGELVRVDLL